MPNNRWSQTRDGSLRPWQRGLWSWLEPIKSWPTSFRKWWSSNLCLGCKPSKLAIRHYRPCFEIWQCSLDCRWGRLLEPSRWERIRLRQWRQETQNLGHALKLGHQDNRCSHQRDHVGRLLALRLKFDDHRQCRSQCGSLGYSQHANQTIQSERAQVWSQLSEIQSTLVQLASIVKLRSSHYDLGFSSLWCRVNRRRKARRASWASVYPWRSHEQDLGLVLESEWETHDGFMCWR